MSVESQNKAGNCIMDGLESTEAAHKKGGEEATTKTTSELVLRVMVFVLTLTAAILLGVDKQTKIISVKLVDNFPPITLPVTAESKYSSAFMFFVASNSIACAYAALSLLLLISKKKSLLVASIMILDVVMVGLLLSSIGAATSLGLMAYQGNSHLQWNKVCNIFGRFCHQGTVACFLSLLASVAFIFLVAITTLRLHKKSMSQY